MSGSKPSFPILLLNVVTKVFYRVIFASLEEADMILDYSLMLQHIFFVLQA